MKVRPLSRFRRRPAIAGADFAHRHDRMVPWSHAVATVAARRPTPAAQPGIVAQAHYFVWTEKILLSCAHTSGYTESEAIGFIGVALLVAFPFVT
jgi:hypothetical protein